MARLERYSSSVSGSGDRMEGTGNILGNTFDQNITVPACGMVSGRSVLRMDYGQRNILRKNQGRTGKMGKDQNTSRRGNAHGRNLLLADQIMKGKKNQYEQHVWNRNGNNMN